MGRLPDNYFGPKQRISLLKSDHPGTKSSIETELQHTVIGEALCITVKAIIKVDDKVLATGHAFTDSPEDEKAVEKAETIAIGRALVNAGYPEKSDELEADADEARKEEPKEARKGLGGGLGKKKQEPKEKDNDSDSSDSSDSDDDSDSEEKEPEEKSTRAKGLGGKLGGNSGGGKGLLSRGRTETEDSTDDDAETDDDDSSEESDENDDSDKEEDAPEEKTESKETKSPSGEKKLTREELLAKYRKGK